MHYARRTQSYATSHFYRRPPLRAALFLPGAYAQEKPKRVGLIGTGWYGKADLLRLIQVVARGSGLALRRG